MSKIFLFIFSLLLVAATACGREKQSSAPVQVPTTTIEEGGQVIHLTKAEFLKKVFDYEANPEEWKYEGDKPAIIDFYADWCGPCKRVAPILERLAKEYDGRIVIYKINTDKEKELSAAFGIRSIPTLLFIPLKEKPQLSQGALPEEAFRKVIDEFLLKEQE